MSRFNQFYYFRCCHTFIEKGFEFDVGIHYVGIMKDQSRYLLEHISDGQIVWEALPEEFDRVVIGTFSFFSAVRLSVPLFQA